MTSSETTQSKFKRCQQLETSLNNSKILHKLHDMTHPNAPMQNQPKRNWNNVEKPNNLINFKKIKLTAPYHNMKQPEELKKHLKNNPKQP